MHFEGKCLERVRASFCSHRNFGLTCFWYLYTTENIPLYYDVKEMKKKKIQLTLQ